MSRCVLITTCEGTRTEAALSGMSLQKLITLRTHTHRYEDDLMAAQSEYYKDPTGADRAPELR